MFDNLPDGIKDDLKILCVMFTEDVGGIFLMKYTPDGSLELQTEAADGDLLYDDIGSVLKVKQIQRERRELLEALEMYYRVMFLGQAYEDEEE